jgi:hypothetical protein
MPLNVPNVGEVIALEAFVNRTAAQNGVLRLFRNNITPADTDVAATYTEAAFPGYAAINLPGASWNPASAGVITYSAQLTFACTGVATDDIYGYYITQVTSGILMWSERDTAAPAAIRNNGDQIRVTPSITAD